MLADRAILTAQSRSPAFEVGQRVLVARHVRLLGRRRGRAPGRVPSAGAPRCRRGCPRRRGPVLTGLAPPPAWKRGVAAVAVEVLGLAGRVRRASAEELLVVRARRCQEAVVDQLVAGRAGPRLVVQRVSRSSCGSRFERLVGERRRGRRRSDAARRRRPRSSAGDTSGRACASHGKRGVDRRAELGARRAGSRCANASMRRERAFRSVSVSARSQDAGRAARSWLLQVLLVGEGAHGAVEVVDEAPAARPRCAASARRHLGVPATSRERSCGSCAEQGLVHRSPSRAAPAPSS